MADIWNERYMTLFREALSGENILVTTNGKESAAVVVVRKHL